MVWTTQLCALRAQSKKPSASAEAWGLLLLGDVRRGLAIVRGDRFSELMDRALDAAEEQE